MKAPFPYFGGKASVAKDVWKALGDVKHYVEPFFGSGAVLLNRPANHVNTTETVNDKDGFISNVWRSIKYKPEETAEWSDWPVNHADLCARRKVLLANESNMLDQLKNDDMWCDPKMAGYWIWAASCWIGSGLTRPNARPHVGDAGKGVHAIGQMPHLSDSGTGVHSIGQRPHVGDAGKGVHAIGKRPHLSGGYSMGMGVHKPTAQGKIYQWFDELSDRLRKVRVVCGDWKQVCGGNWQDKIGVCGVFFDPPYGAKADRNESLYHHDSLEVADEVREWCLKRGRIKTYRIVLAGYRGEHEELLEHGWTIKEWSANGGYANAAYKPDSTAKGKENRHKEALFFSPHCIHNDDLLF